MENRLCLNKKVKYTLPSDVCVSRYEAKFKTPNFTPDLCICMWGASVGKVRKYKENAKQLCIKTDNKELLDFISSYNWGSIVIDTATPFLSDWKFKKIILEEFYGVKNGE